MDKESRLPFSISCLEARREGERRGNEWNEEVLEMREGKSCEGNESSSEDGKPKSPSCVSHFHSIDLKHLSLSVMPFVFLEAQHSILKSIDFCRY
jgi:hypothetical protein